MAAIGEVAGIGEQPGGESLHALIGKRAAAADAIADAVVEAADAEAVEIDLRGVGTDLVVSGVAEVEAFAVKIDLRSVHAVFLRGEGLQRILNVLHVVGELKAHDVEAEAIDLVLAWH